MELFKVKTLSETEILMCETFSGQRLDTEIIGIECAGGRILADDIKSEIDVPHFDRSVVDGYAVRLADVQGASETMPIFLKIAGHYVMGEENSAALSVGECMYVPTGGMVPAGTQAMVMIEHTQEIAEGEIAVYKSVAMNDNMLLAGEDVHKGETVLTRGKKLCAQDIGVLAGTGVTEVSVYIKPRFTVISTGDELILPGEALSHGRIRDINTYTIAAEIIGFGGEVVMKRVIRDDREALKSAVLEGLEISDVVMLSGGSSVGNKDYTYDILNEVSISNVIIHGISVKPGKPTIVANAGGKPLIGLPGQPASALIVLIQMLETLHQVFYGVSLEKEYIMARLDQNIASAPGRTTFQMVSIENTEDGVIAKVSRGKSGMISLLSSSWGYFIIDANREGVKKGEPVKVFPLR